MELFDHLCLNKWLMFNWIVSDIYVTMNESQMKIPAEREQDFVWHVEQRNKKAYLKFNVGENWENVE